MASTQTARDGLSPGSAGLPAASGRPRLPELLAPAGDWDCARAAVENGADAIYFGLDKFNARMRAHNFAAADLPKLVGYLHRRGVKGYVTLNTLIFENELADAEQCLRAMILAGVDAVIVQDVGLCRLIRRLSPDFPIHASTQMTITSAGGVEFARELGCNLVVLARECSIKEIEKIRHEPGAGRREPGVPADSPWTPGPRLSTLPLEVFVHGALCVAYSGQCLTSEALGGRSANRGECAQACRMPYDLIADGHRVPLGDRRYLVSPQDLAGLEVLPELVRAGVASLKIEGRLKTPEYVANITRLYRTALDRLGGDSRSTFREDSKSGDHDIATREAERSGRERYDMEMAFSRGLHTGWLLGVDNQQLVHGRFGKKRGVYLGKVTRVLRDGVALVLEGPLKPGDGVVFDAGKPETREEGGRVYQIRNPKSGTRSSRWTELRFGRHDVDFKRIHAGDRVWKTSDPELEQRLRRSFEDGLPKFRRPVEMEVRGRAGQPLELTTRDEFENAVRLESALPLTRAEKPPLTTERLRRQLGRLGGTPFTLGEFRNLLPDDVVLPVSELNRLRREAVIELERRRARPKQWTVKDCQLPSAECRLKDSATAVEEPPSATLDPQLIVVVRNLAQLETALGCGVRTIYCDFENPKKYRDAVRMTRESQAGNRELSSFGPSALEARPPTLFVAPPRIFKTGEEWTLQQVRSCGADGYLVRNYDHLKCFSNDRRVGDYTFNVANRLAADYFKNRFGLERVTASYDLNFPQLEALLQAAPAEWFEVTIHQHMPMFHMEHCVFCAFLSSGTDYTNCGRPCDVHDVKLRDRMGAEHPVKADVGCRNTVFNAVAQTGAECVSRMLSLGVRHFRIEFLNETPEQVAQTIGKYSRLLRGEISGAQVWRELKLINQLGVTRGQAAGRV